MSRKVYSSGIQPAAARVISRLFDPVVMIPVMLTAAVVYSVVNGLRWRFILLLLLVDGFIPFLYFVHLLSTKEISDWDTTDRRQRRRLYWFTVAVHGVGVVLASLLGKVVLAKVLFSFWLLAVVFSVITMFWKISLHAGVSAAAVAFLVALSGPRYWLLLFLVALIGWARVRMGKHTLMQTLTGAVLALAMLTGLFLMFGLTRSVLQAPSQEHRLLIGG